MNGNRNMDISRKKKYCTDLRNVKQWLHSTKTRCDSLKSHMEYMKMLYHDIPQIPKADIGVDSVDLQNLKTDVCDNEITVSKQMDINNITEEFHDVSCPSTNDDDNNQKHELCLNSNLQNIISKINVQYKQDENIETSNMQKETEVDLYADLSTSYNVPDNTQIQSRPLSPMHKENMYREQNHILQYPHQKDLVQYSPKLVEDVSNPKKLFEQLILDNQNEHLLQEVSSTRNNIKLNISGSMKDGSSGRNKISSKSEKNNKSIPSAISSKKGSLCKLDNIVSLKLKKRRRKIHCSNSKSTVTTRDTNFLGRKDAKRRKQKNNTSNNNSSRSQQTSNEVVEIYHNSAATSGSTCVISNKHSKLNRHMNYINILSSVTNEQKTLNVKPKYADGDYQCNYNVNENTHQNNSQKQYISKDEKSVRTNIPDRNCDLEVSMTPTYTMEKCNLRQCEPSTTASLQASYCDPLIIHNYEMPTLASKLKRANRSCFSRFNFRNIPFVVGTSVTPSHNLGLNIQQVLSIMKTKQPTINGITPLLIRKVSRSMKPAYVLAEQINECSKLSRMNSQVNTIYMQNKNLFINRDNNFLENESVSSKYDKKRLSNLNVNLKSPIKQYQDVQEMIKGYANMYENCYKKKDIKSQNQLNTISSTQILQTIDNSKILKLFASQHNVKLEDNVQDKDVYNTLSDNIKSTKGIREVLVHLHDQFEELNMKYEKLQAKTKKCNDKYLEEEIMSLEKELNAKEDEINAVINLYKEVMVLKRQMKLIQEKNSYICISSEVPFQSKKAYSAMPCTLTKSDATNDQQKLYHKRGSSVISTREPTSIRLAGLLRQIQTFQRQLKLSS